MRRYNSLMLASVLTFCLNAGLEGAPREPADPPERAYVPIVFFDHGAEFPPLYRPATAAEPNSALLTVDETLFGTYSFRDRDTVYNIEFYYRKLFERMRVSSPRPGQLGCMGSPIGCTASTREEK